VRCLASTIAKSFAISPRRHNMKSMLVLLITLLVLLPFRKSLFVCANYHKEANLLVASAFTPFAVRCQGVGKISFTLEQQHQYIQVSVNGTFLEYLPMETSQLYFTAGNKPHDVINALCGTSASSSPRFESKPSSPKGEINAFIDCNGYFSLRISLWRMVSSRGPA